MPLIDKTPQNLAKLRLYHISQTKKAIKESFTRDLLLKELVNTLDTLDLIINQYAERLRHWATDYYPEAVSNIQDNKAFADFLLAPNPQKDSMGATPTKEDTETLQNNAIQLLALHALRQENHNYLVKLTETICPNTAILAGPALAARLIAETGSLKRFSQLPATTIQLLGAEAALYRHLKTQAKPPKYGHLYIHPLISKSPKKEKGKRARALAAKIALTARVDYFGGKPIGQQLLQELTKRFTT